MKKDKTLLSRLVKKPTNIKEYFKPKWLGYEGVEPKEEKEYTKDCVYVYDKNDNEIYYESINEYWHKKGYDKSGNEIYFENNNKWWKKEYDKKSNIIYYENSDKEWWKIIERKKVEFKGGKYYINDIEHILINK